MISLSHVTKRLDNSLDVLSTLMQRAELNEDAAYDRLQLGKMMVEVVAAKRLISGLSHGAVVPDRRRFFAETPQDVAGRIVIDGAPGIGTTEQGVRTLATFDRAIHIPCNAWPPVAVCADSEGGEF